jgi:hypothetical protein
MMWYVAVAALISLLGGWALEKLLGSSLFSGILTALGYSLLAVVLFSVVRGLVG